MKILRRQRGLSAIGVLMLTAVLLGTVGCQDPPSWEAGRARAAVQELKSGVQADRWAPAEYQAVEEALKAAEKELSAQQSRFAFSRDFGRAAVLFASIPKEADLARAAATARRKQSEQEAREALEAARAAIAHARATMLVVPVSDGGRAAQRLGEQVDRSEQRLEEVRNRLTAGEFLQARDTAVEILAQVNDVLRGLAHPARR